MGIDNPSAVFDLATDGKPAVLPEWLPSGRVRPLILNDPGELWLEFFGSQHGLAADDSPYEMMEFIGKKSREFQEKWIEQVTPEAIWACAEPYQAGQADAVQKTLTLIANEVPVIAKPALWWAPEQIYAYPDLIVHQKWLKQKFPKWLPGAATQAGEYLPILIRFTTMPAKLSKAKETDLSIYQVQLRLAAYILGQLQGAMPASGFLVARNKVFDPLPVTVTPQVDGVLDADLAALREHYADIRLHGDRYVPWEDPVVAVNQDEQSGRWRTAKEIIARQKMPGGDPCLVLYINNHIKDQLAQKGMPNLKTLLEKDPSLNMLKELTRGPDGPRLGEKNAGRIHAILQANRSGQPLRLPVPALPARRQFEFYVDVKSFSNLNVDFEHQWPGMEGHPMVFMIGVGWEENSKLKFKHFRAAEETDPAEKKLLQDFLAFLGGKAGPALSDANKTNIFHWSSSDRSLVKNAAEKHGLQIQDLPWVEVQKILEDAPVAVPGAWDYSLKPLVKALAKMDAQYDPQWIGDLADENNGERATVFAWQMYARGREEGKRTAAEGFSILSDYLAADTRAGWQIVRWLRSPISAPVAVRPAPAPKEASRQAMESLVMPAGQRVYAALNQGKGIQMYLHPQPGKNKGKEAINHLIWGDWMEIIEREGPWLKVQARGTTGWVHQDWVNNDPLLEVNFVDVGQGDGIFVVTPKEEYLLIDAGLADNMYRFLRWRFNHFKSPVNFKAMVITHPDQDHYAGFLSFFNPKDPILKNLHVERVYHNGIIERGGKDLGAKEKDPQTKESYLTDIIQDRANLERVIQDTKSPGKNLGLMKKILSSQRVDDIKWLAAGKDTIQHMPDFGPTKDLRIEVLAPVPEGPSGKTWLRWFGTSGKTKNGHSVVLRLVYRDVSFLLGGDLNIPAEKYLMDHYNQVGAANFPADPAPSRKFLNVDIAKSCHHGSADFSNEFVQALNAVATVISSGDEESYCHPRPESLGAVGHFGRGARPLIFSTELARSAPEKVKHPYELRKELEKARKQERVAEYAEDLIMRIGRSISVYGMITLRSDGHRVLIAQKLEKARTPGQKWDQYLLKPDAHGVLSYTSKDEEEDEE